MRRKKPLLPIQEEVASDSQLTTLVSRRRNYPSATIVRSTLSRGSAGVTRKWLIVKHSVEHHATQILASRGDQAVQLCRFNVVEPPVEILVLWSKTARSTRVPT